LNELCHDQFRAVYDEFTDGLSKRARALRLVEYADRHRQLDALLAALRQANPKVYEEVAPRLGGAALPPPTSADDPTQPCDVLILAANPRDTDRLRLQEEADLICQRLQEAEPGRGYRVRAEWAVRADELSRHLLRHDPVIVHFCGHGNRRGDLVLEDGFGQAQAVTAEALAGLSAPARTRAHSL